MQAELITLVGGWLEEVSLDTAEQRINAEIANSRDRDSGIGLGTDADPSVMTRVAMHEAAHAVVAHMTGYRVTRACVRRDGSGIVEYEPGDDSIADKVMAIVRCLAGVLAELVRGEIDMGRRYSLKNSMDISAARHEIERLRETVPSWDLTEETFAKLSYCTVSANWSAIVRVAAVLKECGEIDGNTVAALCGPIQ